MQGGKRKTNQYQLIGSKAFEITYTSICVLPSSPGSCLMGSTLLIRLLLSYNTSAFFAKNCWSFNLLPLSLKLTPPRQSVVSTTTKTPLLFFFFEQGPRFLPQRFLPLLVDLEVGLLEVDHDELGLVALALPDLLQLLPVVVERLGYQPRVHRVHLLSVSFSLGKIWLSPFFLLLPSTHFIATSSSSLLGAARWTHIIAPTWRPFDECNRFSCLFRVPCSACSRV